MFPVELYNILVVDDEVSNLNALARTFRSEYDVFLATSGKDALNIMKQKHIDFIIADHRMPGMTGIELLEEVRRKYPGTIRIILTAYTDENLLMDAISMGHVHSYITKPWKPEEIKFIVRQWRVLEAERKHLEEERLRVQKLESIVILAGGIAHDFNNVLTSILGNISLAEMYLRDEDSIDKISERLKEAKKASIKAKDLTQQLLTFSRGGAPIKKLISIGDIVRESASFTLRNSKVKCEFSIPDDLWLVEVDEGQMSPVISNLTINADQAMPDGGVIKVRAENVNLDEKYGLPLRPGAYVNISIEDQGVGIPKEHLQRIFNPYFTTKEKSSGLGLSTSYSIIKNHHGHIVVESQVEVGSTFHIYIPACPEKTLVKDKEEKLSMGKGRILVMDDEEMIRETASEMLRSIGYEATTAVDGTEAIELYKRAKESSCPFDLVIMDLTIPGGMGGKKAIQKLIEIDPDIKAIVSSGYSNDSIMANFEKYGFSGVIAKPYRLNELSEVLNDVMMGESKLL